MTAAVHRLIARGNAARDARRWDEAQAAYSAALDRAPALHHIHVQHGHALKQAGRLDEAQAAYAEAIRLKPDDEDAWLHRLDLVGRTSSRRAGLRLLIATLTGHPDFERAEDMLLDLLLPVAAVPAATLRRILAAGGWTPAEAAAAPATAGDAALRVFDITDLVGHFRHQRLPNGIERVQIEILLAMLDRHGDIGVGICCFVKESGGWVGVPVALFRNIARLATASGDTTEPLWLEARAKLLIHLAMAPDYKMPVRGVLLNLGTSWWVSDYFRHVRNAKARRQLRYIPLVYDLIPLVRPRYCSAGITRDFTNWLTGALRHADGFMAISRHSRDDLLRVADRAGRALAADRIAVIPLDANFRHAVEALPAAALEARGLSNSTFALMVSTIEPRKNHALAFDAWAALLRRHGPDKVPRLVCVGRDGWLNDPVFARLELDPLLAGHVTLIHRVPDEELALLYRSCRFTVYPSLYEGWGLPVTEGLSHGRVAIVADNSSLPEAGGELAVMFPSGSLDHLVAAVERVAFDDRWRREQETRIAARFVPRSWALVADQIDEAVTRLLALPASGEPALPLVQKGKYYLTNLPGEAGLSAGYDGGEDVRIGDGWLWPEADGCRTAPNGGEVRLRVDGSARPLRLHCRLRGLATQDCLASIASGGRTIAHIVIPAGKIRWLACDMAGPDLSFVLHGEAAEMVDMPDGPRAGSVTLMGLLAVDQDMPAGEMLALIDRAAS